MSQKAKIIYGGKKKILKKLYKYSHKMWCFYFCERLGFHENRNNHKTKMCRGNEKWYPNKYPMKGLEHKVKEIS